MTKTKDVQYRELARLSYHAHRNDLYSEPYECSGRDCVDDRYDWQIEIKIPRKLKFTGYNDTDFFKIVNAEPTEYICKCGKAYRYQWLPGEVVLEERL